MMSWNSSRTSNGALPPVSTRATTSASSSSFRPGSRCRRQWANTTRIGRSLKRKKGRESKGSDDADDLRGRERRKIECGKAHFSALGVDYKVVTSHHEV